MQKTLVNRVLVLLMDPTNTWGYAICGYLYKYIFLYIFIYIYRIKCVILHITLSVINEDRPAAKTTSLSFQNVTVTSMDRSMNAAMKPVIVCAGLEPPGPSVMIVFLATTGGKAVIVSNISCKLSTEE